MAGTPRTTGRGNSTARQRRLCSSSRGCPQQGNAARVSRLRRMATDVDTLRARCPDATPPAERSTDLPPRIRVWLYSAHPISARARAAQVCHRAWLRPRGWWSCTSGTGAVRNTHRSPTGRWRARARDPLVGISRGAFHVKQCAGHGRRSRERRLPYSRRRRVRTEPLPRTRCPPAGRGRPSGSTVSGRSRESPERAR